MDNKHPIAVDGWSIDASKYIITRDGVEKKLEPRSMALLLYLAQKPGEVVTRQEIEEHVWHGRVVGYDALSSSIAKLRKAFGDSSRNPRVIKTIPKAGYQLIAPVSDASDEDERHETRSVTGRFERKLSAVLYADVAEYSRLTGEDEERTHQQLRQNMGVISDTIFRYKGRISHFAGDAVLADFDTASAALRCALEAQRQIFLLNSHLPESRRVLFRIGVNLGEVIVDGEEIYGEGVNVAARLEQLANPGGVLISGTVFDAVGQNPEFDFKYRGDKTVKNIQRPVRTYAVTVKPESAVDGRNSDPAVAMAPVSRPAQTRRNLTIAVSVATVAGVFVSAMLWNNLVPTTLPPSDESAYDEPEPDSRSLAILPFRNISNDPGQGVYADGLTDDLITDLGNVAGLQVAPRHSSFQYQTSDLSLQEIAHRLRVRYLVTGSIRLSLEDIRVNVQLVDSRSDREIWAQRFDDKIENIFSLQDRIIGEILGNFDLGFDRLSASKRRTSNLEAYDYFLRAEHRRLNLRGVPGGPRIIEFYENAIDLDPKFVAAYTGLAREALSNWQLGENKIRSVAEWKKLVYDACGKALDLDPDNAEALAILGLLQAVSGDHEAAIASVQNALESDPGNSQIQVDLATVLSYSGFHEQALAEINRAIERLNAPPFAYFGERARIHFFLGNYAQARDDSKHDQNRHDFRNFAALVHAAANDLESARRIAKSRLQSRPWENRHYYSLFFAYYRRPEDIETILEAAAKAGIPRYAYGFEPDADQPLSRDRIQQLVRAGPWRGSTWDGLKFEQRFEPENRLVLQFDHSTIVSRYQIFGRQLCATLDIPVPAGEDCGPVYPGSNDLSYHWIRAVDVYRFAVER